MRRPWFVIPCLLALSGCAAFEGEENRAEAPMWDEASTAGYAGEAAPPAPTPAPGGDDQLVAMRETGGNGPAEGQVADKPGQGPQGGQNGQQQEGGQGGQQPTSPLLIYQAELRLGVFEVEATQRAVITIAKELGGYLAYQDDARVTIRVPARRFQDALEKVEQVGDVNHRNVQAIDVSEEFRDTTLRLRNAEVVRERLEAILARAEKVEDALAVQRELARVTEEIEQFKGKLRYLQDRIAFSTVTVIFEPKPTEQMSVPQVYALPFPWLDRLGLPTLLELR
jgi:hypothetical protein